jgi:hypothetical protein
MILPSGFTSAVLSKTRNGILALWRRMAKVNPLTLLPDIRTLGLLRVSIPSKMMRHGHCVPDLESAQRDSIQGRAFSFSEGGVEGGRESKKERARSMGKCEMYVDNLDADEVHVNLERQSALFTFALLCTFISQTKRTAKKPVSSALSVVHIQCGQGINYL